jgi:RES domain
LPLPLPPAGLGDFPRRRLPPGFPLFRIHRARFGLWHYSNAGNGRFDLVGLPERGTCYFAEQPEGCFLEVFRSYPVAVPEEELSARLLTRIELPRGLELADCTDSRTRVWGLTAEIHSTPAYQETQAWAEAFARLGFDGLRYFVRHDPSQQLAGIALFGPAGSPAGLPESRGGPIREEVLHEVERRFGIKVLSAPL